MRAIFPNCPCKFLFPRPNLDGMMPQFLYFSLTATILNWLPGRTTPPFHVSDSAPRLCAIRATPNLLASHSCWPELALQCWSIQSNPRQGLSQIPRLKWSLLIPQKHRYGLCTPSNSSHILPSEINNCYSKNDSLENVHE